MANIKELLERNKAIDHAPIPYLSEMMASGGPLPGTLIVTCVDPRCVPENFLNFGPGEVAVHRNAGGNIRHAIRDIHVLDALFKLKEIAIIHHTDCGTTHYTNDKVRNEMKKHVDQSLWADIDNTDFGPNTDMAQSVREDLEWIRANPLVREELKQGCQGFVFDIKTGKVESVSTV